MQSLHSIIKEFIKDSGIGSGISLNAIRRKWQGIVGQPVSDHTYPDTIRNNVLTVVVDTPQWLHHLGFFKEQITGKLKPYQIDGISFRLGRLPEQKDIKSREEERDLSEDDMRFVENTLKNVKDDEIRQKFRRLIIHGLTRGKVK